ncbi:MAG: 2'-5' RNA ligase, partial [uncultured Sphingomonadaceae bacterium]
APPLRRHPPAARDPRASPGSDGRRSGRTLAVGRPDSPDAALHR